MLLEPGGQDRLVNETTVGAGSTAREVSVQTDSVLVSVYVDAISSGTLDVSVYTLTDEGKEKLLYSFPTISAPSTELLLKQSVTTLSRVKVVATYTGTCTYEIYARAVGAALDLTGTTISATFTGPTNPLVERVSVAAANTEFTYVLPALVKRFMVITEAAQLKVGYVSGQSGVNYVPVPRYGFYSETDISPATLAIYYQSPTSGHEITIVSWV